jgi:large subunit ribosomal protein L22
MKTQTAKLRYLHIAPRKVRLVANAIKGLSVNEAEAQLLMSPRRPASDLIKLLRSAVANAKHNAQLSPERLFVKEIRVDQGPMLERYMPRAMGRATAIQKKSSHVTLVLAES